MKTSSGYDPPADDEPPECPECRGTCPGFHETDAQEAEE